MERQKPEPGQRKTSAFNPEAATFSPTHIAAISKGKESTGSVIATPPAIPRELFKTSTILKRKLLSPHISNVFTHYETDDSPLRPAENMPPIHHGELATSRVPFGLEDSPFRDIPIDVLQKMLLGEPSNSRLQSITAD